MGRDASSRTTILPAACVALAGLLAAVTLGCAEARVTPKKTAKRAAAAAVQSTASVQPAAEDNTPRASAEEEKPPRAKRPPRIRNAAPLPTGPRTFADLLASDEADNAATNASQTPAAASVAGGDLIVDDARVAAAGIRKLQSQHLTLYTDLAQNAEVDELPQVFDLAVPPWCQYFGKPAADVADWHMTGCIMQEKSRFAGTGLLPADLPPFPNGYQRGRWLWVHDQPTGYYRRHLLLHEGTHAFMDAIAGGLGPPWYSEGMAELLGTHRWQDGRLTLGYMPRDKTETPGWGRIKIIRDELAAGRGMMPANILDFGPQAHLRNEPYGWCWGWATFLDSHPQFQQRFRRLPSRVREADLTAAFRAELDADWASLNEDWQVFVMTIEYGYDLARAAIVRRSAEPLAPSGTTVTIAADRGWQSTGVRIEASQAVRLDASGRFQVGETTQPWWCEPNGVTIHYYRGQPLGMLLAAIRDDSQPLSGLTPLVKPQPVGAQATLRVPQAGTLYLKINESAADLSDNRGEVSIRVQPAGS